jgi:hypothetical protein
MDLVVKLGGCEVGMNGVNECMGVSLYVLWQGYTVCRNVELP